MPTARRFLIAAAIATGITIAAPSSAQRAATRGPAARGATAAPPTAPVADTSPPAMGTYVSSRIDGKKLPVRDLATDDQGMQYLIEFAELVMSIKANAEFRASLRYRQTLARKGERASTEPLRKMTVYGSWSRDGTAIRFVPDSKRGGEGLRILAGTASGKTVTVPFDYQNGRVTRRANVLLVFDPKIF